MKSSDQGKFFNDPVAKERVATVEEAIEYSALYQKIELNKEVELQDGVIRGTIDGNRVLKETPMS